MVVDRGGGGGVGDGGGGEIAVYGWRTTVIGSVDGSSVDCIIAV